MSNILYIHYTWRRRICWWGGGSRGGCGGAGGGGGKAGKITDHVKILFLALCKFL